LCLNYRYGELRTPRKSQANPHGLSQHSIGPWRHELQPARST
jgi:hypothetical protein